MMRQGESVSEIDDWQVLAFLRAHSTFLLEHPDLLADMEVAHESGAASSLIERQVAVLRDQRHHLRGQLNALIKIAGENDALAGRFRTLSLAFMDVDGLVPSVCLLESSLRDDFGADQACLLLYDPGLHGLVDTFDSELMRLRQGRPGEPDDLPKALSDGLPVCGRFSAEVVEYFFGSQLSTIASLALVPIMAPIMASVTAAASGDFPLPAQPLALLAIGSVDAARFHADQGTVFLEYLGALLARKIA